MTRRIFADTASLEELKTFIDFGICDGVTTNQKLFLEAGRVNFRKRVLDICQLVGDAPVSVETTKSDYDSLLLEARTYARWHRNIVVKVAMYGNGDGLRVVSQLAKERIKTNMTCMMNFNQLLLAYKAGATYISLFYNRAKDSGLDPDKVIREIAPICGEKLIVGSIRKPEDVEAAFVAGAGIVTIPHKQLVLMPFHPKTDETIKEFDEAWEKFKAGGVKPL